MNIEKPNSLNETFKLDLTQSYEIQDDGWVIIHDSRLYLHPDGDDLERWHNEDMTLKSVGREMITESLTEALIANIHHMHADGLKDSAIHLREIIKALELGFVDSSYETKEMPL